MSGPLTQPDTSVSYEPGNPGAGSVDFNVVLYRKDKTWFWAHVKRHPLAKKSNGELEFFSLIEDISEQILAETTLKNSESRLSALIKNIREGILVEDETNRIVISNSTFCSMFNITFPPEQLIGTDCRQSVGECKLIFKDPGHFFSRTEQVLMNREAVIAEEFELANGQYYSRDYIPIITGNQSQGHLWKYQDISDRKNLEKNLRRKEEKYRNIIANMKLGLVETDNEDIIRYVNPQFCDMSGYTVDELIGQHSIELLVDNKYRELVSEKSRSRNTGIYDLYPVEVKTKTGEVRWWLTSGGPNFNDQGQPTGTIGISIDITEQKMLEKELEVARQKAEEASHAKETFLATMSHEIRTPLHAVIGLIRGFVKEELSPGQLLYIKNIDFASQHLLSLVNDILDITKIESGQMMLDMQPFSLKEEIENVISILSPAAKEKLLNLNTNVSSMLSPAYLGDSGRIRQMLINIIDNAIKFTEKGGVTIECFVIDTTHDSHKLQLLVTDTGIGMDDNTLRNIFNKFSQGDLSATRRYGGAGLGMAITQALVRLMNGTITVSSRIGSGTVVDVKLSLEKRKAEDIVADASGENYSLLTNRKVLIVEDNELNRLVAMNVLSPFHMNITEAPNGAIAIEKARTSAFDAILMDLQMPVMDGIEATRIIRHELGQQTPVIALTANAFKAELDRCMEAGINDYITKPFDEKSLLSALLRNMPAQATSTAGEPMPLQAPLPYDLSYLNQVNRGNREMVLQIIRLFIEQTPQAINQIREAWKKNDLDTVYRLSHQIKPTIKMFGIETIGEEILSIERMSHDKQSTPELGELIGKVEKVIGSVIGQMTREELA